MKTNVYVDGLNLFYGCLRGTCYRWLDIARLVAAELPNNQISRIRYFTAIVSARPPDGKQPERQKAYLRALQTTPNPNVHYGQFRLNKVWMALVNPPQGGPNTVEVWKSEEKGSDVNIATYLLLDAFHQECAAAVIVRNDSDLVEPIRIARKVFGIKVVVLHPLRPPAPGQKQRGLSIDLRKVATKSLIIREQSLANRQFPVALTDSIGTITKPAKW